MDVRDLTGKQVLVTGAASGIGKETALACARRGANLVICDLDAVGLSDVEKTIHELGRDVIASRVDVSDAEQMRAFAEAVHGQIEAPDILVNNAGVAIGGRFQDTSIEDWNWIVGINLMGVVHGCHHFIPKMVKRGRGGHVVIVASAAGYSASSNLAAYNATKFAVLGLGEALQDELRGDGIGVTVICPGIIDTPITRSARLRGEIGTDKARERMVAAYRKRNYTPARVAGNILKAIGRNRVVAPISAEAWLMYYLKRFAPWLMRRLNVLLSNIQKRQLNDD